MNSGPTSERVYDALKDRLLSGTLLPDEKLEPAALAADLNSSVTPVRDALHRLSGERLVESRPSEGFHVPHVNEPALRDLYAWNGQLLALIVRTGSRALQQPVAAQLPAEPHAARALFGLVGRSSGNIEHAMQVEATSDRLSAARHAEMRVLTDLEDELRELAIELDRSSPVMFVKRIASYHRRRINAVPEIVRTLYRG